MFKYFSLCHRIQKKLVAFIENELTEHEKRVVEAHLKKCKKCALELESLEIPLNAPQTLPSEQLPDDYWKSYVEKTKEKIAHTQEVTPVEEVPRGILSSVFTPQRMPALRRAAGIAFATLLIIAAGTTVVLYNPKLIIGDQETFILGQASFLPDSKASLRIITRKHSTQTPIQNAVILVDLKTQEKEYHLFKGATNAHGTVDSSFIIPDVPDGNYELKIYAQSKEGKDTVIQNTFIKRDYKILLTTDKPLYQPGQTIHIRALTLKRPDLKPAAKETLTFEVSDSKGNKIFKKTVENNDYGIASTDFVLADEVNLGNYAVKAILNQTISEKNVKVDHYVLPKFKVSVKTEKTYYTPGEKLKGRAAAFYFFGKPVADGNVTLTLNTFDVKVAKLTKIQGKTDRSGVFTFETTLPDYFAGSGLEHGKATIAIEAAVTDTANHKETTSASIPVSQDAIAINLIPEGGNFVYNVENTVYILTSYPDGTPAEASVTIQNGGKEINLDTDETGIGEFTLNDIPQTLVANARDVNGNEGERKFERHRDWQESNFLLRCDKAIYSVGDTLHGQILSYVSGTAYLDIVKSGQTLLTQSVELKDAKGEFDIDIIHEMTGTLELHVYQVFPYPQSQSPQVIYPASYNSIKRDTKLVLVSPANELTVNVATDKQSYLPGEKANLQFQVRDENGNPAVSALGLNIVDESVYALEEQYPGMEKVYFMLEKALLEPRFEVHGWSIPKLLIEEKSKTWTEEDIQRAAKILTARAGMPSSVSPADTLYQTRVSQNYTQTFQNPYQQKLWKFNQTREKIIIYGGIPLAFLIFIFLIFCVAYLLFTIPVWMVKDTPLAESDPHKEFVRLHNETLKNYTLFMLTPPLIFLFLAIFTGMRENVIIPGIIGLGILFIWRNIIVWYELSYIESLLKKIPLRIWFFVVNTFMIFVFLVVAGFLLGETTRAFSARDFPPFLVQSVAFIILAGIPILSAYFYYCWRFYVDDPLYPSKRIKMFLRSFMPAGALICVTCFAIFLAPVYHSSAPRDHARQMQSGTATAPSLPSTEYFSNESSKAYREVRAGFNPQHPIHLRQFFPETLFFAPSVITDESGHANVEINMADSITTWRGSALASSLNGALGSNAFGLKVFQEFFIDLDLPVFLTQNDIISIPVAVYNYLPEKQTIWLEMKKAGWFELLDTAEKSVTLAPNQVRVVMFTIKAKQLGVHPLTVSAYGSASSDAIQKEVEVTADGKEMTEAFNGKLSAKITQPVNIPENAVSGTEQILVKIYPGILTQAVEGLDSILKMPYGCFEQTSSTTYPNVLVLNYMKRAEQITPEIQMKAEQYINLGYQRLVTFEVADGGFSLYGKAPASKWLTAYGLMEFVDMRKVYAVDDAIISRTQNWLLSQRNAQGYWSADGNFAHGGRGAQNMDLLTTAYIAWALAESGVSGNQMQSAVNYIKSQSADVKDAYTLSVIVNALARLNDRDAEKIIGELLSEKIEDEEKIYWSAGAQTMTYSYGKTADIETTALAAHALLVSESHHEIVEKVLNYLIETKDGNGTWYNTQATILSLKAFILSLEKAAHDVSGDVTVSINGKTTSQVNITKEESDVLHLIDLKAHTKKGANTVGIRMIGKGSPLYQIVSTYSVPWKFGKDEKAKELSIDVSYDRTQLKQNDTARARVEIRNNTDRAANMVMVDLGVPPGFDVVAEDFNRLVAGNQIEKFSLTGRQVILYMNSIDAGQTFSFNYRLKAKFPIRAKSPASRVYEYYNPEDKSFSAPVTLQIL